MEEKILYEAKLHWYNYIFAIIIAFTLVLIPISVYIFFYQKTKKIELTNKKFSYTYGLLSRKQLSIKLEKIESIEVTKNIIDMIFGAGKVVVSGTGGKNDPISGVENPYKLKEEIEKAIDEYVGK